MLYDPERHHRRSVRLMGHGYRWPGAYLVTLCVHRREPLLGEVRDGVATLSALGQVVERTWMAIPTRNPRIRLDAFVVMPNHLHALIILADRNSVSMKAEPREAGHGVDAMGVDASSGPPRGTEPGSLAAILQNFKSVSTRAARRAGATGGEPLRQRNYYEHIVRTEDELLHAREYVLYNPLRWDSDENNILVSSEGGSSLPR